ncbi:MAG: ATP-binding cassette domain-containing protein [Bacilli bacterium]|nr:ATP-binding cassette domain-containing protein [Bacilli bacterium]
MSLIELRNVSRFYISGKEQKKYALKAVSLSFPNKGLISILGKSGCGKSTLLNLIGGIDKASEGIIYFDNEDISKFKEKDLMVFRSQIVSYIFQHYHLLEDQTALYNVMLPALINGDDYKTANKKAKDLLNSFSINKELFNKKCADLSGGEKERIAILRSLINKPKVILADEPTGALDKNNAILTMETLKKMSKECLVIMVTHNASLAEQYSDRIIKMSDGRVTADIRINNIYAKTNRELPKKHKTNYRWMNKIVSSNFVKRFKRNIFSILSLVVGLVSSMLIFGFSNGKDDSIVKSMERQFDYGTASICKENKIISPDSPITLIQTMRPSYNEMQEIGQACNDFRICYSYDSLITSFPTVSFNDKQIDNFSYSPIYSFSDASINRDLLIKGKIPSFDTLNQVVVNQVAYRTLNNLFKYDSLNSVLRIKEQQSYSLATGDGEKPYVTDYFVFDRLVQIVGVVKEVEFLNSPKIFYSYLAMDDYMNEAVLNNLSVYLGDTTWKDAVIDSMDNDPLSSYSCRLFLKDAQKISSMKSIKNIISEQYSVTSNGVTVEETLLTLVNAASVGMEVFLGIALVGVVMILGIISFASYNEDIKDSAILLCYGATRDDIAMIYVFESIMVGIISVVVSFLVSVLITKPINLLIERFTSLINVINIPFLEFHNRTLLFPLLIIGATLFICVIATYLPIGFSKRISLKEELKAND